MVHSNPVPSQEAPAISREGDGSIQEPRVARPPLARRMNARLTAMAWRSVFRFLNLRLKVDRRFRRLIFRRDGQNGSAVVPDDWRSTIVLASRDGSFSVHAIFAQGRVKHGRGTAVNPDLTLTFRDAATARALLTHPPSEMLEMMLRSDLIMSGNLSHASRFGYLLTALAP
ncbi:MAG: hypothetical protein JW797_04460, partial [Bradymonadales bacterium]|nr:hypothetical protein [Bradymonadales bacterium]